MVFLSFTAVFTDRQETKKYLSRSIQESTDEFVQDSTDDKMHTRHIVDSDEVVVDLGHRLCGCKLQAQHQRAASAAVHLTV